MPRIMLRTEGVKMAA